MSNAFNVNHLNFTYSEKQKYAVYDVSCQIKKGSFTCIVGTNGSGKSTFAKLLAGLLEPESGTIEKDSKYSALVFQNSDNQFVFNTVEEDVAFGPENLCFPPEKIREVVDDSLKKVGMFEKRNRAISSLSEGEKQLVAIAGALALSSDCLILDEPISMLNSGEAKMVIDYIQKLNRENGTTVVCITQNPEVALHADSIMIMHEGKLSNGITVDEFVSNYERYTYSGIVLSETIKLIKMLKEKGLEIDLQNYSPESIVEEILKKC